jgi:WD40 repeat protein
MSNVAGGGTRLILPGPLYKGGANCVAFSGDSKLLGLCRAAGVNPFRALEPMGPSFMMADYAVQLVDSPTGDAAGGFMRQGSVDRIAFSPDGRWIAAARAFGAFPPFPPPLGEPGNLLHLWERQSGEAAKLSTSYHFDVGGLAFSPDSTELAVANKKHISLLDVRERQEVHRFDCHSPCYRAAFSPDGKFIAAADSHGLIYAWEVSTGKKLAVKAGRTWCRHSVIFSPAGEELVAASEDNATTIRFWDVSSGEEVKSLSFPEGAPCPFFFTPDGKAIVGGGAEASPVIHVWDVNTGKELQRWDLTPVQERGGR